MKACSTPIVAEIPHRMIEPVTPKTPSVKPSDPSRNPGLQSAMTNPSHQRSVLSSWRSSTTALAVIPDPPRLGIDKLVQAASGAVCIILSKSGQPPADVPRPLQRPPKSVQSRLDI